MPTYEFYCEKCKKTFSVVISISDYDKKKYKCPKCKGKKSKAANHVFSDSNL